MRICAEQDDISDTSKISTALQCLTILLSGIILRICDIIILICNNHADI